MLRTQYLIAASIATLFAASAPVFAQNSAPSSGHVIVVKLVVKGGSVPFGFEPASITAQNGDTVRFVEEAGVMHNVHFKSHPSGAKLGTAGLRLEVDVMQDPSLLHKADGIAVLRGDASGLEPERDAPSFNHELHHDDVPTARCGVLGEYWSRSGE